MQHKDNGNLSVIHLLILGIGCYSFTSRRKIYSQKKTKHASTIILLSIVLATVFVLQESLTRAGATQLSAWATQLRTPKIYRNGGESLPTLCPI